MIIPKCCTVEEYWYWKFGLEKSVPIMTWDDQFCADATPEICEQDRACGRCHRTERQYQHVLWLRRREASQSAIGIQRYAEQPSAHDFTCSCRSCIKIPGRLESLQSRFLDALREERSINFAADSLGMPRTNIYRWREKYPEFRAQIEVITQS